MMTVLGINGSMLMEMALCNLEELVRLGPALKLMTGGGGKN